MSELTQKQAAYVAARVKGLSKRTSAIAAGYADWDGVGKDVESSPAVQTAIVEEQKKYAEAGGVTREEVMEGLRDAVSMAHMIGDPSAMIRGWSEIAKIAGIGPPKVEEGEINANGKRVLRQLENLSDAQLAALANGVIIDGTAKLVEPN